MLPTLLWLLVTCLKNTVSGDPIFHTTLAFTPRVEFSSGIVEGKTVLTSLGKKIDSFLGIPFGEAPLGRMRFKEAGPAQPWTGVLETKEQPLACYQVLAPLLNAMPILKRLLGIPGRSEDCLKLNLWRPHNLKSDAKLPVMVWIYGGGFAMGSNAQEFYQGEVLASEEEVIVVSMNYRVGSMGFMYLGTEEAPGNAGLYDQLLALKWVKRNIDSFGGDSRKVTLFGQSAGAASVGFHLLSPMSVGLFQRAILQSGSPIHEWAYLDNHKALEETMKLAENLGCPKTNLSALVECFYKTDPEEIVSNEPIRGYFDALIYKPTVDNRFLLENPRASIENGSIQSVDIMIGQNKNEGSYFLTGLMPLIFQLKDSLALKRNMLDYIIAEIFPWTNNLVKKMILTQYNDWTNQDDDAKTVEISEKIFADYYITCPLNKFVNSLGKLGGKVYRYYMTHRLAQDPSPKWYGVVHGEEVPIVFGLPLHDDKASKEDIQVTRLVMKYWSNFAKYGDPNGKRGKAGEVDLPVWPEYNIRQNNQMDIHYNTTSVNIGRREKYCALWDTLVPELMKIKK